MVKFVISTPGVGSVLNPMDRSAIDLSLIDLSKPALSESLTFTLNLS